MIKEEISEIEREPSEWCRMWWSQADEKGVPRILLVGDSIAVGYSGTVIGCLSGQYAVDYLGTSRSINDPALKKEIGYMLAEGTYQIVHVNNGLHGWHVSDSSYERHLQDLMGFIRLYAREATLTWAHSTPVTLVDDRGSLDPERNAVITSRNRIAAKIMSRLGIRIDDLYKAVEGNPEIRCNDAFHYTEDGNRFIGRVVASFLTSLS